MFRSEPLIWRKWVDVSGRAVEVEVKEGEEVADGVGKVSVTVVGCPQWM